MYRTNPSLQIHSPRAILSVALLSVTLLATPADAQQITGLDTAEGTIGTVFNMTGTGLGPKPKLVLVQNGELVKKTKLKVIGKGDGTTAQVELKKALAGEYNIAIRKGKTLLDISADTFTVMPPEILDVAPGTAQPGDSVVASVAFNGSGKPRVEVGTKNAKVTSVVPVLTEGGAPSWDVTFIVPKVPDGVWPLVLQNRVGTDFFKSALDVNGSPVDIGKAGAAFDIAGGKPMKSSKKKIIVEQDQDTFDVASFAGGKKAPRTFTVTVPGQLGDLEAGSSFSMEPANVVYTETKKGESSAWFGLPAAQGNTWAIDVIAVTDDMMSLFVCGTLTKLLGPGPDSLFVSGVVTAPRIENDGPDTPCEPFATATFETLPDFVATPQFDNVFATYNDIGGSIGAVSLGMANSAGPVNFGFSTNFDFDPNTQTSGVITGLSLSGTGLRSFAYTEADATSWVSVLQPDLSTPITVTITDNIPSTDANDGARGYLVGTFSGTLRNILLAQDEEVSGSFCTGWANLSDF